MDEYVWVSRCVCGLVVKKGDLISSIFEASPECLEDLSLYILVRRPRKKLCPRKPTRPEEGRRMQSVRSWGSVRSETSNWSVGSETPEQRVSESVRFQGGQLGVSEFRVMKTTIRWVSIFRSCVRFSLSSRDSHERTYIECWSANFNYLWLQF